MPAVATGRTVSYVGAVGTLEFDASGARANPSSPILWRIVGGNIVESAVPLLGR